MITALKHILTVLVFKLVSFFKILQRNKPVLFIDRRYSMLQLSPYLYGEIQ